MQIRLPTTTTQHQQGTDQSLSSQQEGTQGWGRWPGLVVVNGTGGDEHGSKPPAKRPKLHQANKLHN